MAKTLLLLEVNRGAVPDDLCGDCRFAKPSTLRRNKPVMWCWAFAEPCAGKFAQPLRLEVCQLAEAEAFR